MSSVGNSTAGLGDVPWFARLPSPVGVELARRGRTVRRKAGEWLYSEGDTDLGLVIILSGGLYMYTQMVGGRQALLGLLRPGMVMGQTQLAGGEARMLTAIASVDSTYFVLPDPVLREVAARHPALWEALLELTYAQMRRLLKLTTEAVSLDARQRLLSRLLDLSFRDPAIELSQTALGEMIGASRKAVNGWLGELERDGRVRCGYGRIEVLDRPALERMLRA